MSLGKDKKRANPKASTNVTMLLMELADVQFEMLGSIARAVSSAAASSFEAKLDALMAEIHKEVKEQGNG